MRSETVLLNRQNELQAIQRVIARARTNAHQGVSGKELGRVLNDVQDLLTLTLELDGRSETERAAEFATLLLDVQKRYFGLEAVASSANE